MRSLGKLLIASALLIIACNPSTTSVKDEAIRSLNKNNLTLTDDLVNKYVATYKDLKTSGPEILTELNKKGGDPQAGKEGFEAFEKTLKKNGFKDYPEFVKTNAKIAWSFSICQAGSFMNDMNGAKDAGLAQIEEQLKNPDLPGETREALTKAREQIISTYAENNKWANASLDIVKNLVNDEDLAVIKRHQKELLEAFTGMEMPEVPEGMSK